MFSLGLFKFVLKPIDFGVFLLRQILKLIKLFHKHILLLFLLLQLRDKLCDLRSF